MKNNVVLKQTWLTLMLFATILPVILWQHSKFYWIHYREKCPTLGDQYLFILGVLIGQCKLTAALINFCAVKIKISPDCII